MLMFSKKYLHACVCVLCVHHHLPMGLTLHTWSPVPDGSAGLPLAEALAQRGRWVVCAVRGIAHLSPEGPEVVYNEDDTAKGRLTQWQRAGDTSLRGLTGPWTPSFLADKAKTTSGT